MPYPSVSIPWFIESLSELVPMADILACLLNLYFKQSQLPRLKQA